MGSEEQPRLCVFYMVICMSFIPWFYLLRAILSAACTYVVQTCASVPAYGSVELESKPRGEQQQLESTIYPQPTQKPGIAIQEETDSEQCAGQVQQQRQPNTSIGEDGDDQV